MPYFSNLPRLFTTVGLIGSLCLLSACGGSGGDDTPKNNNPSSSSASTSSQSSQASEASSSQASQVAAKPNSPTSLDVSAIGFDQVTLKWQAPANLTNVAIYRILRDGVVIGTTDSPTTSYTDTDLTPVSQYTYRVQSGDGNDNWSLLSGGLSVRTAPSTSPISSSSSSSSKSSSSSSRRSSSSRSSASSSAPQTDFAAPSIPTNLQSTGVNHNRIDLWWETSTDNVDVTLYRIVRDGEQVATVSGQGQTYLDLELEADTEYAYQVQAGDDAGNWSELTPVILVRTVFPPVNSGANLEWTHPTRRQNGNALTLGEIGGYEVRYRRNSLENFQSAIIEGNWTTTYPLGGIPNDYDFQIAVYDTEGLYSEFIQIYAK